MGVTNLLTAGVMPATTNSNAVYQAIISQFDAETVLAEHVNKRVAFMLNQKSSAINTHASLETMVAVEAIIALIRGNRGILHTGTTETIPQKISASFSQLTVDNLGVDGNTITASTGALNLNPAEGSPIVLDSVINVDAGVVTGATSITSTAFVGALTGDVTGNVSGTAATVTGSSQGNITTLAALANAGSSGSNTTFSGPIVANEGVQGALTGNVIGNVNGNLEGNVIGNIDGIVGGNTPAAVTGTTITANTGFVGAIDGVVGGNTPAAITGTTITANTGIESSSFATNTNGIINIGSSNSTLVVGGNFTVSGTTTTINTEQINLADNVILLNSNLPNTSEPVQSAGFEVNRGSSANVSFTWDESQDRFTAGNNTIAATNFIGNFTIPLVGGVNRGAAYIQQSTQNVSTLQAITTDLYAKIRAIDCVLTTLLTNIDISSGLNSDNPFGSAVYGSYTNNTACPYSLNYAT